MTELPRWVLTHARKLNKLGLIRVDLRRSWQMHSWLALAFTVAGSVLAALYLITSWPDTATPAHLAAIVLNTFVIVLSAVVLGIAAAVIVQSLDRKVYNGADIEYMLGVEPMVELPDLGKLSDEETKELLLPLAGGIIHACSDDALRRCIFTGTGPETGVTEIAARTKETLEAIGRSVVLVDADGATPSVPDAAIDGDEAEGKGTGRRGSLILTDTAPLLSSADTEYLARFADCVIVVAESGVTTREQLRNTVKCLQKLNVAAVGFVLNRAKETRPRVKSRRSLDRHIDSGQFAAAIHRALAHPPVKIGVAAKRAPHPQPAASLTRGKDAPKPAGRVAKVGTAQQSTVWEQPGIPRWMSEALVELEAQDLVQGSGQSASVAASTSQRENVAEKAANRLFERGPSRVIPDQSPRGNAAPLDEAGTEQSSRNRKNSNCGSGDEPQSGQTMSSHAAGEPLGKKPSRLSSLRGLVSTEHLKELRQARRAQAAASETNPLPGESRQEVIKDALAAGQPSALVEAVNGSPMRLGDLRGLITPENLKELNQARSPLPAADDAFEPAPADQREEGKILAPFAGLEQAPSATEQANGAESKAAENSAGVPAKPAAASNGDRIAPYGEVQILPARRGQYRKK